MLPMPAGAAAPVVEAGQAAVDAEQAAGDAAQGAGDPAEAADAEPPRAATARPGGPVEYRPPRLGRDETEPVGPEAGGTLFTRLQQLQEEVMALRGIVESQQAAIEQLRRDQRSRYLDLDRRISQLTGASPATPGTEDAQQSPAGAEPDDTRAPAPREGERAAYEEAFALTRARDFEAAIAAFENFVQTYPSGRYVPNAWYWLGELHLALPEPNLESSRAAFVQVLEGWPNHRKVPDTLYKLGVVHEELGEATRAREYLERVRDEHPDSSAARLAGTLLEQLSG